MNDLEYIDTLENGNSLLFFPCDGVLFYFESVDYSTIRIHTVDCLEGAETDCDEFSTIEELPKPVRAAISRSQYRMRSTKTTLEGAMGNAD